MEKTKFGVMKDGTEVFLYKLQNKNGMEVVVTDLGAVIVNLFVPGKDGKKYDVVLGYPDFAGYEAGRGFHGAIVGRNGNRIDKCELEINGKVYKLAETGKNLNLHSGPDFFCKRKWNAEEEVGDDAECVTFFMNSPDGDQGFPGNMDIEVTYTLTEDNELMINYYGLSDQDTIMNMTNHSYFNLNGHDSGNILGHKLMLNANFFNETDDRLVPTGNLLAVSGTPMDFRTEKTVGRDIDEDYYPLKQGGGGYDHNFIVNDGLVQEDAELVARCTGDKSGIVMEVYTDLPGIQIYTQNMPKDRDIRMPGKNGAVYGNHQGICFETQFVPDAVHHSEFAQPIIKANEENVSLTVFRFMLEE